MARCVINGCDRKHSAKGFCAVHYYGTKRQWIKRQLVLSFGEICFDCKQHYPDCVFEFDHLPEYEKEVNIAKLIRKGASLTKVKEEAGKCQMVCSNCHAIRTQKRATT